LKREKKKKRRRNANKSALRGKIINFPNIGKHISLPSTYGSEKPQDNGLYHPNNNEHGVTEYFLPHDPQRGIDALHYQYPSFYEESKEKKPKKVPYRMAQGITVVLCGVFLLFIPHPLIRKAGIFGISSGATQIWESWVSIQEKAEEEKEKKK
jgi:hypothetical protein